jgi:bisphosphoglycerate-dependent phosphoglycerate mutase
MHKLILAHEGAMALGGVGPETDYSQIGLSNRGREQAVSVGLELSRISGIAIKAAFTAQTEAAGETAQKILQYQQDTVRPMSFSGLNESSFGKISIDSLVEDSLKIEKFHRQMARPLLIKNDVLVVIARSPYMAYVNHLEQLSDEELRAAKFNYCEVRAYEIHSKNNKPYGPPVVYRPR